MTAAAGAGVPWRFQFSGTLKAIYVMRYAMFAGGAAIALAVAERAYDGHVGIGLGAGLLIGLFLFRSQLRPFRVPAMGLGRERLHFVHRHQDRSVEWEKVASISAHDRHVALVLEGGGAMELLARDYGISAQALATLLQGFLLPARRALLPADAEVRRALGVTSDGASSPGA